MTKKNEPLYAQIAKLFGGVPVEDVYNTLLNLVGRLFLGIKISGYTPHSDEKLASCLIDEFVTIIIEKSKTLENLNREDIIKSMTDHKDDDSPSAAVVDAREAIISILKKEDK